MVRDRVGVSVTLATRLQVLNRVQVRVTVMFAVRVKLSGCYMG